MVWNGRGGFIDGGTLTVENQSDGTPYLNGAFNLNSVTLGSDLTVTGEVLIGSSSYGSAQGLDTNGHTIRLDSGGIMFDGYTLSGYAFSGTIDIYGQAASLEASGASPVGLASSAVINVLAPNGGSGNTVYGFSSNFGTINVGSPTVSDAVSFLGLGRNEGSITVYSGDRVDLGLTANSAGYEVNNGILRALVGGIISITPAYTPPTIAELASKSMLDIQLGSRSADAGSALERLKSAGMCAKPAAYPFGHFRFSAGSRISVLPTLFTVTSVAVRRNALGRRTAWLGPLQNTFALPCNIVTPLQQYIYHIYRGFTIAISRINDGLPACEALARIMQSAT